MIGVVVVRGDISNKEAISNTRMLGKAKEKISKIIRGSRVIQDC